MICKKPAIIKKKILAVIDIGLSFFDKALMAKLSEFSSQNEIKIITFEDFGPESEYDLGIFVFNYLDNKDGETWQLRMQDHLKKDKNRINLLLKFFIETEKAFNLVKKDNVYNFTVKIIEADDTYFYKLDKLNEHNFRYFIFDISKHLKSLRNLEVRNQNKQLKAFKTPFLLEC